MYSLHKVEATLFTEIKTLYGFERVYKNLKLFRCKNSVEFKENISEEGFTGRNHDDFDSIPSGRT